MWLWRGVWRQDLFDALPVFLQPGRKFKVLAEVVRVFIHGEARRVGSDLEEDPARLAEMERKACMVWILNPVMDPSRATYQGEAIGSIR